MQLLSYKDVSLRKFSHRRECSRVKDEMRNMEHEALQVETPANTNEPATTIFCYKHA